jgi:hypothetical protein
VANYRFRPEGAEGPCALSGRSRIESLPNPGRCPGLALTALSAQEDVDFFEAPVDCFSIMECRHL